MEKMEKNEFDRRLNDVLRAAAVAGSASAKRSWRVRNGLPPEPVPVRRLTLADVAFRLSDTDFRRAA
jgi:hypothetical protein